MFIARDKDNSLKLHEFKPERTLCYWGSAGQTVRLDYNTFSEVRWKDEPVEVCLVEKHINEDWHKLGKEDLV